MIAFVTSKRRLVPFAMGLFAQIQLDSRFRHCVHILAFFFSVDVSILHSRLVLFFFGRKDMLTEKKQVVQTSSRHPAYTYTYVLCTRIWHVCMQRLGRSGFFGLSITVHYKEEGF